MRTDFTPAQYLWVRDAMWLALAHLTRSNKRKCVIWQNKVRSKCQKSWMEVCGKLDLQVSKVNVHLLWHLLTLLPVPFFGHLLLLLLAQHAQAPHTFIDLHPFLLTYLPSLFRVLLVLTVGALLFLFVTFCLTAPWLLLTELSFKH